MRKYRRVGLAVSCAFIPTDSTKKADWDPIAMTSNERFVAWLKASQEEDVCIV